MPYSNPCPYCGANLDPGEKCDCQEKKENGLPDANQTSPMRDDKSHIPNITQKKTKVKANPLRDLRISKNLSAKDMVCTVRVLYPKYDRMLQSKCEHGDEYGVDIKVKALYALFEKFAPERLAREKYIRGGCHRLSCKVMCRLEDDEYEELKERVKEDGFDTMQEWLSSMIRAYLRSKPKKQKSKGADL